LESIDGGPVTGSSTSTVETRYRINAGGWGQDSYETASLSYPLSDAEAETDASEPARSTESILEEYRARSEQAARLKATIADPDTDPAMIDYFQDLLDDENNILADLTTEATAAGIPQSELNQIDAEATGTAVNDPISISKPAMAELAARGRTGMGCSLAANIFTF